MAARFEFRLIGTGAPAGELDAGQLVAIIQSLTDVASRVSRGQTNAERRGRLPARAEQVAKLTIGLAVGSTTILARRTTVEGALDFELRDEIGFDEQFQALVEAIAADVRPGWVSDSLATGAGSLRAALERSAKTVAFSVDGQDRATFDTAKTHSETWSLATTEEKPEPVTFVGRLRAVNLDSHRLQATDDIGTKVALPSFAEDEAVGHLLNHYITAVGTPEYDSAGRLVSIRDATIETAGRIPGSAGERPAVPLSDILAAAPGAQMGGIPGLTLDEAEAFLEAIGR